MLHTESGAPPGTESVASLSRRQLLARGGRVALTLTLLGAAVPACGSGQAPEPDPLEAELAAARSDAALATAASNAAPAALAPPLRVIADERNRHAAALVEEIARAAGRPTPDPQSTAEASTAPTGATPAPPGPPPGVRQVAEALRRSAENATRLVPSLSGYRAGLMGSIAASCTAAHTVGLPPARRPR